MESLSNNISVLVIKKGQWVLDAIVAIAKKNGISYTRKELYTLGGEICARLDQDKLRADCLVQPGQVIDLQPLALQVDRWLTETLPSVAGFVKYTDPMGQTRYTLNGKEMPKIKK